MAGRGYVHPHLRFAIVVPETAGLLEEGDARAIFAVAGEGLDQPAIVTVEVQAIDPEWDSDTFAAEALAAQAAVLGRLRVIDRERVLVDEHPAVRVLLQRRDSDGRVVVLEEWRIAQQGRGWTVSAMCPVASYWALAPLIGATAASFVPPDAVAPCAPAPGVRCGVGRAHAERRRAGRVDRPLRGTGLRRRGRPGACPARGGARGRRRPPGP